MKLIKCDKCLHYFEEDDVEKVEQKIICYVCIKHCKNCNRPYDYPDSWDYCYYCLEGGLV